MPIVSGVSWEACCRGEQQPPVWEVPAMPPTLCGVPGMGGGYDARAAAAAVFGADSNAATHAPYLVVDQAAPLPSCAGSQAQRCPLRDISNVSSCFASGLRTSKVTDARRPTLPPTTLVPAAASAATADPSLTEADGHEEASEYVPSIFGQLFSKETVAMPRAGYMDTQVEVNPKMRGILVDWLVDVQAKYKMRSETLFLTVNLIDRYLSRRTTTRRRLQLVGVVAMLVAAKFEEVQAPRIESLVYITDNAYTRREILDMEGSCLAALGFQVLVPTAVQFLERLQRASRCDDFHRNLAQYVLELGLVEYRMISYEPSRAAAAALYVSNRLLGVRPAWPESMSRLSRWSEGALEACAGEYQALLDGAPHHSLQAVRKKFSEKKRAAVAKSSFRYL